MKVAFIIYPDVIISNKSNGVRAQATTWGEALKRHGIDVVYINNWDNYEWDTFDAFHFFGLGQWALSLAKRLRPFGKKLIISPIIDPAPSANYKKNLLKYKISTWSRNKVHFNDNIFDSTALLLAFDTICTRTKFEKDFISVVYHIPTEMINIIPLSYSEELGNKVKQSVHKENFCLHISSIYQKRKNVLRLIQAAKKFDFKLVLAGNKGTEEQFAPIKQAIGNAENIEVLGFISEKEKIDLYQRAKVFALPSIQEGVGIVALDAAVMGCEIVISNINGPKEYYHGQCKEVNPFCIDEIGQGVCDFLNDKIHYQPKLATELAISYSLDKVVKMLVEIYSR